MTLTDVAIKLDVSENTARKWAKIGLKTSNGKRFKLKSEKRGRRIYVSEKDFNEFVKVRESLN